MAEITGVSVTLSSPARVDTQPTRVGAIPNKAVESGQLGWSDRVGPAISWIFR